MGVGLGVSVGVGMPVGVGVGVGLGVGDAVLQAATNVMIGTSHAITRRRRDRRALFMP
jgi:hypothetical protein